MDIQERLYTNYILDQVIKPKQRNINVRFEVETNSENMILDHGRWPGSRTKRQSLVNQT